MKRSLALLSLAVLSLTACQPAGGGGTIKLGLIAPLTGDVAGLGADVLHGAQIAIDKVNAAGGINGKKIELIAEDGRCNGADAASAAQKLVNVDKVFAIIGGLCSGETLAAAPIVEDGKIVLLSPTSSSPDVTKAGDYVFRNYPSDALKTTAMVKYFATEKLAKVAMISENTDFSQAFRNSLKEKLAKDAVAFDEVTDAGSKDFRSLMTRLNNVKFDVFFANGNSDAVIGPMMQQLREAGITAPAITHDAGDSVTMAKSVPETEGLYAINIASSTNDPAFEKSFTDKFGDPKYGISFGGYAYDAVNVIAAGLTAGAEDGTALKDWLYAMPSFTGVVGTFHFDKNGDVVGIPYVLKQYKNGVIETLKPIAVD